MLSANTETVQSKVFLKVVMLILLKVKKKSSLIRVIISHV